MSIPSEGPPPRRVVLIGLGPTTRSALDGLDARFDVAALVRPEDDVTADARTRGTRVVSDVSLDSVAATIAELAPDAVVVSSYDRILPAATVDRCPFVNVHYAPLPRGRGRATVNWAIINGDDRAWISIHHLVAGLDAGGILFQDSVPIGGDDTVATLYEALNDLQRRHLPDAVAAAIDGDPGRAQDPDAATYLCTRVPDDGEIDWRGSTDEIQRLVRALQPPYPSAFSWLGLERLDIVAASAAVDAHVYEGRIPGRVVRVDRASGAVDVLTGDGVLRIDEVRLGDGEVQAAAQVVRSVKSTLGLQAADLVRELRRGR